jgi:hypothetical protein
LIKIRGSIKLHEGDIATTTKNTWNEMNK